MAVKNAIKVLWKYYEDFINYQEGENLEINRKRKEKFFEWYKFIGLNENLCLRLDKKEINKKKKIIDFKKYDNDGK